MTNQQDPKAKPEQIPEADLDKVKGGAGYELKNVQVTSIRTSRPDDIDQPKTGISPKDVRADKG